MMTLNERLHHELDRIIDQKEGLSDAAHIVLVVKSEVPTTGRTGQTIKYVTVLPPGGKIRRSASVSITKEVNDD